eukprot:TRINITY_DN47309_c0_g1_i1.p1 TRINITY_DN47309_c0_g1~~TRINITY_DN47309_c0_g1_i1.p1  ORF type:complete len:708 (-),score=91.53 TRINITY_DN47309_c0_g1_i1:118-1989(-)
MEEATALDSLRRVPVVDPERSIVPERMGDFVQMFNVTGPSRDSLEEVSTTDSSRLAPVDDIAEASSLDSLRYVPVDDTKKRSDPERSGNHLPIFAVPGARLDSLEEASALNSSRFLSVEEASLLDSSRWAPADDAKKSSVPERTHDIVPRFKVQGPNLDSMEEASALDSSRLISFDDIKEASARVPVDDIKRSTVTERAGSFVPMFEVPGPSLDSCVEASTLDSSRLLPVDDIEEAGAVDSLRCVPVDDIQKSTVPERTGDFVPILKVPGPSLGSLEEASTTDSSVLRRFDDIEEARSLESLRCVPVNGIKTGTDPDRAGAFVSTFAVPGPNLDSFEMGSMIDPSGLIPVDDIEGASSLDSLRCVPVDSRRRRTAPEQAKNFEPIFAVPGPSLDSLEEAGALDSSRLMHVDDIEEASALDTLRCVPTDHMKIGDVRERPGDFVPIFKVPGPSLDSLEEVSALDSSRLIPADDIEEASAPESLRFGSAAKKHDIEVSRFLHQAAAAQSSYLMPLSDGSPLASPIGGNAPPSFSRLVALEEIEESVSPPRYLNQLATPTMASLSAPLVPPMEAKATKAPKTEPKEDKTIIIMEPPEKAPAPKLHASVILAKLAALKSAVDLAKGR